MCGITTDTESYYKNLHCTVHYRGADVMACDNSDLNPFMLALEKGNKEVAHAMLSENSGLACDEEIVEWALEKNLTIFFQV